MMPELHVVNLVTQIMQKLFKAVMFLMALDRYGWIMSFVSELNEI